MIAFVHAFWAMDRDNADEVRLFEVVVFLFTGEGFIDSSDLDAMDFKLRSVNIVLTVFGTFFFLACALNVFIAVLGDCYDQEQERMVCTFLESRAKICSDLML